MAASDQLYQTWARPKNIVIAVDGSAYGDIALNWALNNMYDENDILHLVHCYSPLDTVTTSMDTGLMVYVPTDAEKQSVKDAAEKVLETAVTKCTAGGDTMKIEKHLIAGDPRTELCRIADELKADAVVVGCRGRGMIAETLLGSVSSHLAHHCKHPLVIVRK